ncbi:MAG: isoprenyl transferase [Promethearchaeota archaeon]
MKDQKIQVPRHVALVPDGNRRYAAERGLTPAEGHVAGFEKVKEVLDWALDAGVRVLTLFALSLDNLKREAGELSHLFGLLERGCRQLERDERIWSRRVRVRFLGDRSKVPRELARAMERLEEETKHHDAFDLCVAVAYDGRDEIARACRRVVEACERGDVEPTEVDVGLVAGHLDAPDVPPPDLVIRTSGERRLSGFLTWQSAYSELVFQDVHFPAYERRHFDAALEEYARRSRRFGL